MNSLIINKILYRGTWSFLWPVSRYIKTSLFYLNKKRLLNAFLAFWEMGLARATVQSRPVVLRIEPCNICPLHCPDCATGTGRDSRPKGFISIENLKEILEQNKETAFIVRLDGMGESTLHPQFFDLIRLVKKYHMSVTVSSNFMTSNCDNIDAFIDSKLDHLIIAVDGATQDVYQKYRIGGQLSMVEKRIRRLIQRKNERNVSHPLIEIQCINFEHNRHQIRDVSQIAINCGADKFTVIYADYTIKKMQQHIPKYPARCYWMWFVLVVGWNLDYRSCTNAWTTAWPDLNLRHLPMSAYWNHHHMVEARCFNKNRKSDFIANENGCKCNRCYEMLVCEMPDRYFCE